MSLRFDLSVDAERETGMDEAARSVQRGRLVVLPTDTLYGIGADAFDHDAVRALHGAGDGLGVAQHDVAGVFEQRFACAAGPARHRRGCALPAP